MFRIVLNKELIFIKRRKRLMKRFLILSASILVVGLYSFTVQTEPVKRSDVKTSSVETPKNVQAIIDKSCIMCHNSESKNLKGKTKLNFDSFKEDYKAHKKIAKYMEIAEEVKELSMPPKKFLEKHPEKNLTDEERATLYQWAEAEAKKISE
jgi:uncharacterized membrane protein